MVSSYVHGDTQEIRILEVEENPNVVLFYNLSKSGVDTADKYKAEYSIARISILQSMRIFHSLFDIGVIDSLILRYFYRFYLF